MESLISVPTILDRSPELQRHNASALVSTLPNELLAAIFLQGWGGAQNGQYDPSFGVEVAQVCTLWREVALGEPLLWTHIQFINTCHAFEDRQRTSLGQIEIFLERSKGAQLSIQVELYLQDSALTEMFASLIRPHLHRCVRLDITDDTFTVPHHLFPLDPSLSCLRELNVSVTNPRESVWVPESNILSVSTSFKSLLYFSIRCVRARVSLRNVEALHLRVFVSHVQANPSTYRDHALFSASCEQLQRLGLGFIGGGIGLLPTLVETPYPQILELSGDLMPQTYFALSPGVKHLMTSSELPPFTEDAWTSLAPEHRYPFPNLRTVRIKFAGYERPEIWRRKMADFLTNQHFLTAVELTSTSGDASNITSPTSTPFVRCPDLVLLHLNGILVDGQSLSGSAEELQGLLECILTDRKKVRIVWSIGRSFMPGYMMRLRERLFQYGRFKVGLNDDPNPMADFVTLSDELVE
ncbi:uncharacterized protein EI90DRAFT_3033813 [Cantharellus anzutake]|uniref:uncharacterized protein n=1 Tax=Cantharellus anzutake TaxID=1750568 RepID=UPI00190622A6|nr:uncharacterized protein EI90DRAFT_3033813 [Cantharellus anzutake]KAF8341394.1 hypothetical protein EI90DRAFT_3033813 [Cantharellus anzutake]